MLCTNSLVLCFLYEIWKSFLRRLFSNVCIRSSPYLLVSSPRFTSANQDRYYEGLVQIVFCSKPDVMAVQDLVQPSYCGCSCCDLMLISVMELLSLERVAPKYLQLLTSSSSTTFMQISALPLPTTMTLLLTVVISIPNAFELPVSLLVRSM